MSILEVFLIGVGLAMDAFAVSICKGLGMKQLSVKNMIIIGIYFGGFQALMPVIGWILGSGFADYISAFDHWIAFVLLLIIGGKMVIDAIKEKDEEEVTETAEHLDPKEMILLAVATSIDALAVGISMAFLEVAIVPAASLIGVTTFFIAMAGVLLGKFVGGKFKSKAEIVGGVILILIGLKILLQHTGIL